MGSMITFQRPDGQSVQGHLAEAAGSSGGPAVVVIQEWWGLNDQIRGVADRLARAGYTALVPDLYRGQSTVEAEEAHHLMTGLDFGAAASQDIRGAVQALKARSAGKVGVTGFCMGGAMTILASARVSEFTAGAPFYGLPPAAAAGPGDVLHARFRVPLLPEEPARLGDDQFLLGCAVLSLRHGPLFRPRPP